MKKIECKAVLLNKLSLGIICTLLLPFIGYFIAPLSIKPYISPISMTITFLFVLVTFYLNRNEVYKINIDNEIINLEFFNKSFLFRRNPIQLNKADITYKSDDRIGQLFFNNNLTAVLRKKSMKDEDWAFTNTFLNT